MIDHHSISLLLSLSNAYRTLSSNIQKDQRYYHGILYRYHGNSVPKYYDIWIWHSFSTTILQFDVTFWRKIQWYCGFRTLCQKRHLNSKTFFCIAWTCGSVTLPYKQKLTGTIELQYLTPDRRSIPTSLVKGQQVFTPILEPIKLKPNPWLKVKQKKAKGDDRDKCWQFKTLRLKCLLSF